MLKLLAFLVAIALGLASMGCGLLLLTTISTPAALALLGAWALGKAANWAVRAAVAP